MQFESPLLEARLLRRYKRFLADVELPDGQQMTVHCPNTGAMTHCDTPGQSVWLSLAKNKKRKYPYTWELGSTENHELFIVNTRLANPLVEEALRAGRIKEIGLVEEIQREYALANSRLDFYLPSKSTYIEVKSVTLLDRSSGFFPDAVTERGRKHLKKLGELALSGARCILLFCVNHSGINQVKPAHYIDPAYSEALGKAIDAGVEALCYKTKISTNNIEITEKIPFLSA